MRQAKLALLSRGTKFLSFLRKYHLHFRGFVLS